MSAPLPTVSLTEGIAHFTHDVIHPVAGAMARGDGMRPRDVVSAAAECGLAGVLTPVAYGGTGGSHADFVDVIEAVAREDASTAVILDVHLSVGTEPIIVFGNDDQKARYLPRLARGEWLAGFALTEPGGGSDAAALRTRAVRHGDTYVLDGTKTFITGAGDAGLYIVMARTGEGARGISAFLVEAAYPGVSAGLPFTKMGLHGSWTGELVLDGVRVPEANRLGAEGEGFRVAMAALDSGRVGISAQATGISQGALDAAVACCRTRPAADRDGAAVAIADMESWTVASRLLTRHAAAMVDAGQAVTRDASIAKLYATDACMAVAIRAVDICAPDSALDGHPTAVRMRDAKACQIYEGTNQIQRVVIARHVLRET